MKKLMVAGCSYSAVSLFPEFKGTHWSEVLSETLGWELKNLARQGCSNGGIRIQVDEIIRQRPDIAIITPTLWDRMEIPRSGNPFEWSHKTKNEFSSIQDHLRVIDGSSNGYDARYGIDNVNYKDNPYRMVCETIFSLVEEKDHPYRSGAISKDQISALKWYVDQLYDSNWKRQQDMWIMRDAAVSLLDAKINFIINPCLLWRSSDEPSAHYRAAFPNIVPDHNIWLDWSTNLPECLFRHPPVGDDPGYHGSPESQTLFANHVLEHIKQFSWIS
jgi:hypothetical protein